MYAKTTVLAVLLQILFVQSLPQNFHRRAKTATFVDNPFLNPQINNNVANTQLPEQLPVKPTALNVQELVENPFFIEFFNQYQKQQTAVSEKKNAKIIKTTEFIYLFSFLACNHNQHNIRPNHPSHPSHHNRLRLRLPFRERHK